MYYDMNKSLNTGTIQFSIFSCEWKTCVNADVAFEVEWVSIVHWKHDLPPTMLSLFDA